MSALYCKPTDPAVALLVSKTFPHFAGKQVSVNVHARGGVSLASYWSGGTRDYHVVVNLADMSVWSVPENGSGYTATDRACGPAGIPVELPAPGFAVVSMTDGHYKALSIHVHEENAAKLLPAPCEITWAEKVVLVATRCLKSSYNGRTRAQEAQYDTGITPAEWDAAKAILISRGLLNKAGAITIEGRNAAGSGDLYRLKRVPADSKLGADRQIGETEARVEV